jgi:hypothetical protein
VRIICVKKSGAEAARPVLAAVEPWATGHREPLSDVVAAHRVAEVNRRWPKPAATGPLRNAAGIAAWLMLICILTVYPCDILLPFGLLVF